MEKLKQCASQGLVEIAKLDSNNKPVNVPFAQLQSQVSRTEKNTAILKFLSNLDWNQRYQWVNLKRLKAKEMYQNNEIDTALQVYLESLLGIDFNQKNSQLLARAKQELQYPILLNIATCLYKKNEFKRAIMICDTILKENEQNLLAIYKKSFLLNKCGDSSQAWYICVYEVNYCVEEYKYQKGWGKKGILRALSNYLVKLRVLQSRTKVFTQRCLVVRIKLKIQKQKINNKADFYLHKIQKSNLKKMIAKTKMRIKFYFMKMTQLQYVTNQLNFLKPQFEMWYLGHMYQNSKKFFALRNLYDYKMFYYFLKAF